MNEKKIKQLKRLTIRDLRINVNDIKWIVTPTMAISKSNETWESSIHTKPSKIHYLTTAIYEKKNDQWYVVHVHQSYFP